MISTTRARSGLTLVEVLIAIVVIAVAFIALSMSQITNLRVTRESQQASLATQAANAQLEIVTQRILADYDLYKTCPGPAECQDTVTRDGFEIAYEVARDASQYTLEGIVRVDVAVTGIAEAQISHYVSCMDLSPPPTVTSAEECE